MHELASFPPKQMSPRKAKGEVTGQGGDDFQLTEGSLDQMLGRNSLLRGLGGPGTGCREKSCGCPSHGSVQGQVGKGLEQPGIEEAVPATARELEGDEF